jgi:hypothetical protein
VFKLAHELHKTVSEVMAITEDEFMGWLAFFQIEREGKHGGGK